VSPFIRSGRRPAFGLLAALLFIFPAAARSDDVEDVRKKIAETEKQIAELQKKLAELKNLSPGTPAVSAGVVPPSAVKAMNWRCIGPANMGGRITAVAAVESDPTTYYVATASGGLLKTTNHGTTFEHLFDHEATVSIGDVAVSQSDPKIVWVGTGENNPRNSVSYGDGVYKSVDGGKTWKNMGLKNSYQIGRVIIHPTKPDTVYVGALGRLYGPNEERGLFKTEDGGKTWKKILYVDDRTGVIDFRLDPFEPNNILVGMWERKRDGFDTTYGPASEWPSTDQYGPEVTYGPGGGLFRSTDAGKTWQKLTGEKGVGGLPTANTGRIGIDFSRKTKGLVFAVIDTENIGKGRPPLTVYMGISSETNKGGGVLVTEDTDADSPAGKAGIKKGDVVTALDGKKIADYDAMIDFMSGKKPDDVVKVTVKRGDKELTLDMKLGRRQGGGTPAQATAATLMPGFVPEFADFQSPVKVKSVPKGGEAEKAGVKPGMEVAAVEGTPVSNWVELRNALRVSPKETNPRKAGEKVKVTFRGTDKDKKDTKVEATLALETVEFTPPAFGGRGGGNAAARGRPHLMDPTVGGQQANVQKDQGKDGFNTGGVYKSTDGGQTWSRVNSLNPRPMYFSQVRTDPNNDKLLYVLGDTTLWHSENGGERFTPAPAEGVHPDHHALWIDPRDSRHMLIGCDGGFYATFDRGKTWDHLNILALGQFYHVCVDNKTPYNVYGGLQDNGSWGGPSRTMRGTGPVNDDWLFLNGGDGFVCQVDLKDPDVVYAESQGGAVAWRNLRTGESKFAGVRAGGGFGPGNGPGGGGQGAKGGGFAKGGKGGGKGGGAAAEPKADPLRFNWNTPFILSHHNSSIMYLGAQYVYRSYSRGENHKAVSPELTSSKQATISALAESPRTPDVLWAGTDDGNVWVTRDGGGKWENVLEKLKAAGLPKPAWVASLEPSRVADGRCYVCIDAHRSNDDRPYLFVTEDFGQAWKPVTGNLPSFGSTRVLREDYTNPNVLYCGTEFGIWASVNRGQAWTNINNNLPTVAVHEVAQPTTASEIVVATHGRSVWVVDVASLRQMSPRTGGAGENAKTIDPLKEPVTLFDPPTAIRWKLQGGREFPYSKDVRKFYGTNPPNGVSIDYLLTKQAKDVSLKISDVNGKVVREFNAKDGQTKTSGEVGFHRIPWNLSGNFGGGGAGGGGRRGGGGGGVVPAGSYRVTLTVDGKDYIQSLIVENDPNADPKAVVTYDAALPGEEEEDREREQEWEREIVPFIPKSKD
jgi:photosystem II stability/assembly factor-like uncharacterized protein